MQFSSLSFKIFTEPNHAAAQKRLTRSRGVLILGTRFELKSLTGCIDCNKLLSARSLLTRVAGLWSRIEAKYYRMSTGATAHAENPWPSVSESPMRSFVERFGEPPGERPDVAEVASDRCGACSGFGKVFAILLAHNRSLPRLLSCEFFGG